MAERRERAVKALKTVRQRALRIDVERRAEFFGERFDGDAFAEQFFANVTEFVHGE